MASNRLFPVIRCTTEWVVKGLSRMLIKKYLCVCVCVWERERERENSNNKNNAVVCVSFSFTLRSEIRWLGFMVYQPLCCILQLCLDEQRGTRIYKNIRLYFYSWQWYWSKAEKQSQRVRTHEGVIGSRKSQWTTDFNQNSWTHIA